MLNQSPKSPNGGIENQNPDLNAISRVDRLSTTTTSMEAVAIAAGAVEVERQGDQVRAEPTDRTLTMDAILRQVSDEATNEQEWMKLLCGKIMHRFTRMPRGGWRQIQEKFNQRFSMSKSLIDLKNDYNRVKNREVRVATGGAVSGEEDLPIVIKDAKIYNRVRDVLRSNVEKILNQGGERTRTKKVYSHEVNYEVIQMMNIVIQKENLDERATTLKRFNDLLYACQLTYEEVTARVKAAVSWRASIEDKIAKLDRQLSVLREHHQGAVPSTAMKRLCKSRLIHSNNEEQVQRLKDQLEEQKCAYEKKIVISERRTEFRRDNKKFEFNRSMFYRNLVQKSAQVDEFIDKREVLLFWRKMWDRGSDVGDFREITRLLPLGGIQIDVGNDRIKEILEGKIRYLANWKTPGPDQVFNFFIKKMYSLHGKLIQLVIAAIQEPEQIEEELYIGNTYLIPKVEVAKEAKDLRPITCLPNIYKLLSKVVSVLVRDHCEVNKIVSENQMGTRRGCQGAKQQALLNKALNKQHHNRLFTSWIDIQKAYDSVKHGYLIEVLERVNLPPGILSFVLRTLSNQQTNLICNKEVIGRVKVEKGLLQGDSLSPLLFVMAVEPLTRRLNRCFEKVAMDEIERNHLIFIDDIKLIAGSEECLVELCRCTADCLQMMGLTVNQAKSASNIDNRETFGVRLDGVKGYRYLGVLEDSRSVIQKENKVILEEEMLKRTTLLCGTKLNAVNLFRGINEYALSLLNYYIGLLPFEPNEYEEMDKKVRGILGRFGVTRHAANMERLYLKRDQLGRGLVCLGDKAEVMTLNLHEFLQSQMELRPVLRQERKEASHLGLIKEYLREKYHLNDDFIDAKTVQEKQEESKKAKIKAKRMHGLLFSDEDNVFDRRVSSRWLSKGNITPQQEGMLTKLQDRNLYFGGTGVKCPHCHMGPKSVEHLATHCGRMLNFDYKKRHDEVVRCLHFQFTKRYGLNKNKKLKNYKVQNVVSNERVKIKSDVPVVTELRIDNNKPDLMVHDLRAKEILLVEVGITNKSILATTEVTKSRKYELLANELKCIHPGTKVVIIPFVMTWDGLVTRHFKRHIRQLDVSDRLLAYIQSIVIKKTCESIMVDCRGEQRSDWLDEEASVLMGQLEVDPAASSEDV